MKKTKKDIFEEIIAKLKEVGEDNHAEFMESELEKHNRAIEKKKAQSTERQKQNEEIRDFILNNILTGEFQTIETIRLNAEMVERFGTLNVQRVSPLLRQLKSLGLVEDGKIKKRVAYKLAGNEPESTEE